MKSHKKTIWFTPLGQTIGIVMYENSVGERKAVIGMGLGMNENIDEQRIMEFGTTLRLDQLIEVYSFLTEKLPNKDPRVVNE